jgi:hypothetical protein
MDAYLKDILEATREAFKSNKQMEMDRVRLRKAERVGPACVGKVCNRRMSVEA